MTAEYVKSPIIEMDGQQVFTAEWTMSQMQAQSCRIDRSMNISGVALALAAVALVLALVL